MIRPQQPPSFTTLNRERTSKLLSCSLLAGRGRKREESRPVFQPQDSARTVKSNGSPGRRNKDVVPLRAPARGASARPRWGLESGTRDPAPREEASRAAEDNAPRGLGRCAGSPESAANLGTLGDHLVRMQPRYPLAPRRHLGAAPPGPPGPSPPSTFHPRGGSRASQLPVRTYLQPLSRWPSRRLHSGSPGPGCRRGLRLQRRSGWAIRRSGAETPRPAPAFWPPSAALY